MKITALKQGLTAFNLLFVATFMVLALYSAIGQQIFPFIGQYRVSLETYLGEQLGGEVSIRQLSGDMDILTPSVHVEGITLFTRDVPEQSKISIAAIDAVLDPRASLINLTPVFKTVRLSGLYVRIDDVSQTQEDVTEEEDRQLVKRLIEGLLLQQHVELNNVTIEKIKGEESKVLEFDHLVMTGDGFNRLISGDVTYGNTNKIKAGIRLYSQGSPFNLDSFYARGTLDLPNFDVDYWVNELFDVSLFKAFLASAQLSFEFENGLLSYSKLSMTSDAININDGRKVDSVTAQVWAKQESLDDWSFWVEDSQFTLKDKAWRFNDIALNIAKNSQGSRWQTYVKSMDVEYLHQFLKNIKVLPKNIADLLADLSPSGKMSDMNVIMQKDTNDDMTFTVAGEVHNISTLARGGIPALTNVNGVIAATQDSGRIQFDGPQISLAFPNIYQAPFQFSHGKGQVDWFVSEQGVRLVGDGLSFNMDQVETVKGGFKAWLYKDDDFEDKLELNLSLTNAQVLAHQILVPSILSDNLRTWLDQALLSGQANTGQFYLYTGLAKHSVSQSELQLSLSNASMQYLTQWPVVSEIDGDLFVQNDQVYARVNSASTLGGKVKDIQVIYDGVENSTLWIQGQAQGLAGEGFEYFQHTPLQGVVDNVMDTWSMSGSHTTELGLHIPLNSDTQDITADVSTSLSNANLNLTNIDLSFEQIQGNIRYRSSKGLTSSLIRSYLWQQPLKLNISSTMHDEGFSSDIAFEGDIQIQQLKQWLGLSILEPITGQTALAGHFKISGQDNGFTGLELTSKLKGIGIELPEPFLKQKEDEHSFELTMALDDGEKLKIAYDDRLNLALHIKDGSLEAGQVYIGATEAYIPSDQGVEVFGHLDKVNANQWLQVWKNMQPEESLQATVSQSSLLRRINVSTGLLVYDDFEFEQVAVDIKSNQGAWHANISAPIAKGLVVWSQDKPIDIDLDYIHWPALVSNENHSKEAVNPLADVFPNMFPDIDFAVDEIFVGPINYGNWKGKLRATDDTFLLSEIDGRIKKLDVTGQLTWVKSQNPQKIENTSLKIKLSSDDVGGVQAAWRTKPVMEAKSTKMNLDLHWQANPMAIQTHLLNGQASVSLKDGRFIDAGDTGALSAFGILNFGAIGRRLRLDFSDVYESGFHFDSVSARVKFNNGLMSIIDTLDIKGPSAKFAASGTVDLNTKTLNQELSVTFPITSTLPFVAILAGFTPPVAASLFVGEQLVGDQIEKYTSATYKLKGTWDEPDLELMKRFDNKIEGKQDQGFWYRMKDFFGLGGSD